MNRFPTWLNSSTCKLACAALCLAVCCLVPAAPAAEERDRTEGTREEKPAAAQPDALTPIPANLKYELDIAPLLRKYCLKCHQGDKARAGVALDMYPDQAAVAEDRETWEKVFENVQSQLMPPDNSPQPTPRERELITGWLSSTVLKLDCSGPINPGRVTIRRLNRVEYNHTIRDLVGVDFQPADDFPSDDVGYGFDNIGDVLTLPPILLEKYLAAAEKIAAAAIVPDPSAVKPLVRFDGAKMKVKGGGGASGSGFNLYSSGEVFVEHEVSQAGDYIVRTRAFGQQAGPDPARMSVRVDGKELQTFDVPAVEEEPGTYEARLRLEAGKHRLAAAFINDFYNPKDPNPKNRDRNLVVEFVELQGPEGVTLELPETHRRIITCTPGEKSQSAACARIVLRNFASRAFRRPATDDEVARLCRLVELAQQEGDTFEQGIQLAVQAVLVSPHFLFRVELDSTTPSPIARQIGDYELASRMSYFLWSSMPDEELFRLAASKTLRKDGNLEAQVRRMLRDPRSQALVENFAGQWLQLRNLSTISPDKKEFPGWSDELRADMNTETELFFAGILRDDRSLLEFLQADYTYLNERLAKHYGIANVTGAEFRKVSLDGGQRGGLLGQASILTVTSNPTRTSPVKRGKWILENLLGTPPPPPPPDVPVLNESKKERLTGSLRQRLEQHRVDPGCAICHQRMDPLGFGLENYDGIGGWRTRDENFDIDASGILPGGIEFKGPAELKGVLLNRQADFRRCLTDKMLTYALGRGLDQNDKCAVEKISQAVEKQGNRASALVLEIIKSDAFQKRQPK